MEGPVGLEDQLQESGVPAGHGELHTGYVIREDRIWDRDLDRDIGLVPRDVRDLMLHGRTLAGKPIWSCVRGPNDRELREASVYSVFWIPRRPPGYHALLNCIFAVAGALLYRKTNEMTWTKGDLVRAYPNVADPIYPELVTEAGRLRRQGDLGPTRARSAFEELLPRYQELLAKGRTWMAENGMTKFRSLTARVPGIACRRAS